MYTYKILQKDKCPWYFTCCLQKELPYCSNGTDVLNSFMHGNKILSPNPKFICSVIFDEEIFKKFNNKYTPTEFINALSELSPKKIKPLLAVKYIFSALSPLRTL